MEVKVTPKPETSQAQLEVTVPVNEFKPYLDKAAKKLSTDQAIKGFRPGKAPLNVVADSFGQERLLHEAMDLALPHFFVQAALDHDLEAINRPAITVEELGMASPFRFTAVVDILPEVKLGDVSKIKVEKKSVEVTDELLDKELLYLAKTRSEYVDVTDGAKKGDLVTVDFAVRMNGEIMDGGESKNHPITIGEGGFIPDFENGLLGLKKDETKTFTATFPKDFPKEEYRDKATEVTVTAHAVQKRVLPEMNDDFAKSLGKFTDFNNLKDELKKNLAVDLAAKEEERYLSELAEKLADNATFATIPEILIEKEIDARVQEFAQMLSYQQKTIEDYMASSKKTVKEVRDEMRESAIQHVKVGLAMRKFATEHDVLVTEEEIDAKANEHLAVYKTIPQAQANIDVDELRERVTYTLKNQKTLKKLAELVEKK